MSLSAICMLSFPFTRIHCLFLFKSEDCEYAKQNALDTSSSCDNTKVMSCMWPTHDHKDQFWWCHYEQECSVVDSWPHMASLICYHIGSGNELYWCPRKKQWITLVELITVSKIRKNIYRSHVHVNFELYSHSYIYRSFISNKATFIKYCLAQ